MSLQQRGWMCSPKSYLCKTKSKLDIIALAWLTSTALPMYFFLFGLGANEFVVFGDADKLTIT
jgi:hypothetical protein